MIALTPKILALKTIRLSDFPAIEYALLSYIRWRKRVFEKFCSFLEEREFYA